MGFRISGLPGSMFRHLYGLDAAALAGHGARRIVAGAGAGSRMPDRVLLRDAAEGEAVLLLNYVHQPAATPFRASHAIYVLEGAEEGFEREDDVPPALRARLLSVRAYDAGHMMCAADVVEGVQLEGLVRRLFEDPATAYLHAHYAKFGCYAARIDRV